MKPVGNSSVTRVTYTQAAAARISWGGLYIPSYVWLLMIIAAAAALSITTAMRAREQAQQAQASYAQTAERVRAVQAENEAIRARIKRLQSDPRVQREEARTHLNYLGANEVPVKLR
ncbi:MAG: septum formation initiator family protein [Blastocatellales bacterium]|nr:septum formation initiator family protein [Blastocatellales bacterium]